MPEALRGALQLFQTILRFEGRYGRRLAAFADDGPCHGVKRIAVIRHEGFDGCVAFRHPRSFVKQPRSFEQRLEVQLDDLCADVPCPLDRSIEQSRVLSISEELELICIGNTDPDPWRNAAGQSDLSRELIVGIEPLRDVEHTFRVARGERKDRDAIERSACRDDTAGADQPAARFQSDDVIEGSGHAPRPRRIGPQCKAHEAARDGDGRAAARST